MPKGKRVFDRIDTGVADDTGRGDAKKDRKGENAGREASCRPPLSRLAVVRRSRRGRAREAMRQCTFLHQRRFTTRYDGMAEAKSRRPPSRGRQSQSPCRGNPGMSGRA
jgi:hypothetical protein